MNSSWLQCVPVHIYHLGGGLVGDAVAVVWGFCSRQIEGRGSLADAAADNLTSLTFVSIFLCHSMSITCENSVEAETSVAYDVHKFRSPI